MKVFHYERRYSTFSMENLSAKMIDSSQTYSAHQDPRRKEYDPTEMLYLDGICYATNSGLPCLLSSKEPELWVILYSWGKVSLFTSSGYGPDIETGRLKQSQWTWKAPLILEDWNLKSARFLHIPYYEIF